MRPVTLALAVLLFASGSNCIAETHALLLTIGAYRNGVPQLAGAAFDADSARAIARRMGVKDENLRHYKDGELNLRGYTEHMPSS